MGTPKFGGFSINIPCPPKLKGWKNMDPSLYFWVCLLTDSGAESGETSKIQHFRLLIPPQPRGTPKFNGFSINLPCPTKLIGWKIMDPSLYFWVLLLTASGAESGETSKIQQFGVLIPPQSAPW